MKKIILFTMALALLLTGCSTPQRITGSWISPDVASGVTYKKIFISAITDDLAAKGTVENSIEGRFREMGIDVVKSTDLFPPDFDAPNKLEKDEMLEAIRASGCDAIFTLTLIDVLTEDRYRPGTPYLAGRPGLGFYRYYYGYYRHRYPVVYSPGYYTTDHTYLVESNLYGARSEKLVWTIQSSAFNPSDFPDWFQGYSNSILNQLKADGLIASGPEMSIEAATDMHPSENSAAWSGTYFGIFPCASCEGIETELYLGSDRTYKLTTKYLGIQENPDTFSGSFIWEGDNVRLQNIEDGMGSGLYRVEENRLRSLDKDGTVIRGELENNYVLTKNGNPMAEDRKWILIELNGRSVREDPADQYIIFHSDRNTLEAKAGCNVLLYPYTIRNTFRLIIYPGISTLMACPDGSLEEELIEVLKNSDNISVNQEELSLNKARMAPLARFRLFRP